MAKEIVIKIKEGLQHVFALKEIVLKGELVAVYPSGDKSSLCPTQYAYGESYIDKIPDVLIAGAAEALIPAESDDSAAEDIQTDAGETSAGQEGAE